MGDFEDEHEDEHEEEGKSLHRPAPTFDRTHDSLTTKKLLELRPERLRLHGHV